MTAVPGEMRCFVGCCRTAHHQDIAGLGSTGTCATASTPSSTPSREANSVRRPNGHLKKCSQGHFPMIDRWSQKTYRNPVGLWRNG